MELKSEPPDELCKHETGKGSLQIAVFIYEIDRAVTGKLILNMLPFVGVVAEKQIKEVVAVDILHHVETEGQALVEDSSFHQKVGVDTLEQKPLDGIDQPAGFVRMPVVHHLAEVASNHRCELVSVTRLHPTLIVSRAFALVGSNILLERTVLLIWFIFHDFTN